MRICLEHLWVLVTRGEAGVKSQRVRVTHGLWGGALGWGGWPQDGKRGRNRQQRVPTQVGDHKNFLGSGFRTIVSVVAGFQNPKTENEGRKGFGGLQRTL